MQAKPWRPFSFDAPKSGPPIKPVPGPYPHPGPPFTHRTHKPVVPPVVRPVVLPGPKPTHPYGQRPRPINATGLSRSIAPSRTATPLHCAKLGAGTLFAKGFPKGPHRKP